MKKLMSIPELTDFSLVGGTALALHYGHRKSVDLDLFATKEFDAGTIVAALENNFDKHLKHISTNKVGIFVYVAGVKVDLIKYHFHPLIAPIMQEQDIRFFSIEDIMAMKVNAILKRGMKKDFWDIAELLEHYSVAELIENYMKKFPDQMLMISIPRALVYFNDAEDTENPLCLKNKNWTEIKQFISNKVNTFLT
ncbi:MAG: nucleotidyl transferase AbiEii/AbiGii toxin family protein [Dysgonamonadaceae bacterium]|nr:nucleotidyl transferase AbiEii/AbiGii toxin family protein [Dysgonamonadaceae bacterium]